MIWAGEEIPRVEEQEDYFVVQIHVGQIHAPSPGRIYNASCRSSEDRLSVWGGLQFNKSCYDTHEVETTFGEEFFDESAPAMICHDLP